MTRWNNAVKQSAQSGGLRTFSNAVQRISGKGLELLHGAFIRVRDLIITAAPTIEKIFNAFTQSFNFWSSNFIKGYGVVEGFVTIIKGLQLERIIGWLTAFIAIQKVMGILAGPVKALVAGMAGIGTAIQGVLSGAGPLATTLKAVNNEVGIMPKLWVGAKTAVQGFGKALWAAIGGGVGAALIGVVVAVTLAVSYFNNLKNGAKDLAEAQARAAEEAATTAKQSEAAARRETQEAQTAQNAAETRASNTFTSLRKNSLSFLSP